MACATNSPEDGKTRRQSGVCQLAVTFQRVKSCFKQDFVIKCRQTKQNMSFSITNILAVIAIVFVLITYITTAPLVPIAVILLGLAILFGSRGRALRP